MANIPDTPGRSRMPGVPNLRYGTGTVTADDLGAREFGEWGRLGQKFGMAGAELQQWGIRKYNEDADADALAGINSGMKLKGEQSNRLMTLKGAEAATAPAEYGKYAKQIDDEILGSLKTPRAKEAYQRRMMQYDRQRSDALDAHMIQEHERSLQVGYAAGVQQEMDNAVMNAGNDKAVFDAVQRIKIYNAHRFMGMPQEYIAQQNQKDAMLAIEGVASTLAQSCGAQAALDFLERSSVGVEVGEGALRVKYNELIKTYRGAAVNNEVNVMAMDLAEQTEAGTITSAEVQRLAYGKYPDDPAKPENAKLRETLLNVYDNHHARLKSGRLAQATQAKQSLTDKLAAVNFNLEAMSPEEQSAVIADSELFQTVTRFQKWKNGVEGEGNPDHHWIYRMEQMQPEELKAWLNEPSLRPSSSNFDIFLRKTAGKQELMNRIYARTKAGNGGEGGSGFSGTAKFDPAQFFENGYGSIFESGVLWSAPESYLDDKTNTAKFRRNGFLQFYNDALAEKEEGLGRKANFEEQQEVAFGLMKSARDGLIDLDKPYWTQNTNEAAGVEQAAPQEKEVDVKTLSYEKKRLNRGENVVSLSPAAGAPIGDFGRIAPDDTRQLSPDIIDYKAKDVLRAYEAGRIGDQDYAADDIIVYGRHDEIAVFDGLTGKMKGAPMVNMLPSNQAAEARMRTEEAELERLGVIRDAEGELNRLLNRKNEMEQAYQAMLASRETVKPDAFSEYVGGKIRGVLHDTFGVGLGEDAKGTPRNNRADMERLNHEKRMRELDSEIKKAEQELKRVSGGKQ